MYAPIQINVATNRSAKTGRLYRSYEIMKRNGVIPPCWLHLWHNGKPVSFATMGEAKEYCRLYLAVRRWWRGRGRRVWL